MGNLQKAICNGQWTTLVTQGVMQLAIKHLNFKLKTLKTLNLKLKHIHLPHA